MLRNLTEDSEIQFMYDLLVLVYNGLLMKSEFPSQIRPPYSLDAG